MADVPFFRNAVRLAVDVKRANDQFILAGSTDIDEGMKRGA